MTRTPPVTVDRHTREAAETNGPRPREAGPSLAPPLTPEVAFSRNGNLRCALTNQPLREARVAPDGFTYEKRAIVAFLARRGSASVSPVAGVPMRAFELGRDVELTRALSARRFPRDFGTCPLTYEKMRDPVLASDEHHYERAAIDEAFARQGRSPYTREPLDPMVYRHQLLRARRGLSIAEVACEAMDPRPPEARLHDPRVLEAYEARLERPIERLLELFQSAYPDQTGPFDALAFDLEAVATREPSDLDRRYQGQLEVLIDHHQAVIGDLEARGPGPAPGLVGSRFETAAILARARASRAELLEERAQRPLG